MQKLEKILEEIEQCIARAKKIIVRPPHDKLDEIANDTAEAFIEAYKECQDIIRKHMNDGWIPVEDEEHRPEEYEAVLCVTEDGYYFTAVYNKEFGFRTDDIGVDGEAVEWCSFQPRPERRKDES